MDVCSEGPPCAFVLLWIVSQSHGAATIDDKARRRSGCSWTPEWNGYVQNMLRMNRGGRRWCCQCVLHLHIYVSMSEWALTSLRVHWGQAHNVQSCHGHALNITLCCSHVIKVHAQRPARETKNSHTDMCCFIQQYPLVLHEDANAITAALASSLINRWC